MNMRNGWQFAYALRNGYACVSHAYLRIGEFRRGRAIPYVNQIHLIGLRPSAVDTHTRAQQTEAQARVIRASSSHRQLFYNILPLQLV